MLSVAYMYTTQKTFKVLITTYVSILFTVLISQLIAKWKIIIKIILVLCFDIKKCKVTNRKFQ